MVINLFLEGALRRGSLSLELSLESLALLFSLNLENEIRGENAIPKGLLIAIEVFLTRGTGFLREALCFWKEWSCSKSLSFF